MHIYLFAVCVIEHAVHDVLGQFGFIRVSSSAHPGVNDALIVGALERYLQKTYAVTQRETLSSLFKYCKTRRRHRGEMSGGTNYFLYVYFSMLKENNPNLEDEAKLRVEIAGICSNLDGPKTVIKW